MKRSREDLSMNSPLRRPMAPSHPEPSSAQPQMMTETSSQKLTTQDALAYLKTVRDAFQDSREKYEEFLEVMKDFKAQRIQTVGVIARVTDLFKGHRNLVLGFNAFLPKGYHINLPPEDEVRVKKTVEFEEAINFVNKIKTRFQGDDHAYKAFLNILNVYRKENKAITEVYEEVSALFSGHPDLLGEFKNFLPDTSATAPPFLYAGGRSPFCRDGISAPPGSRHIHGEKKSITSHDVDIDQAHLRAEKRHDENDFERRNDREIDNYSHLFSQKRKSSRRIEDSIGDQFPEGGEDGENFGTHPGSSSYDMYSREFAFCEKLKERFNSSDAYEEFLKILDGYSREYYSRLEFENQVKNLFGRHEDLVEGVIDYFPRSGFIDGFLAALRKIESSRLLKVEDGDRHSDRERTDRHKDRERGSEIGIVFGSSHGSSQRTSFNSNKDKYLAKPIHELDLSDSEQCTPSYRLLPEDYPITSSSQRTEIGTAVLNDCWVSVTSGSEDYSFKHMRKNQYEESLFRCEDDRFELDMLLQSVNAATKRVEDLLNKITDNSIATDSTFRITDHLTALNLRCIERIYSDHGLDVMDVLKKNAPLALPVVLTRLKQKQEEWARCRADFNKVWAEIYAKNHHKSLDHRSFYFKQQDTKSLSTKALIAEIKELREKKTENDNDVLLATTVVNRSLVIPEMEFVYPDPEIHNDVYKLIKYSCSEICSSEQLDKVLNIWTTFLEPMLGAPRRAQGTEDAEAVLISNNRMTRILLELRNQDGRAGMVNDGNGVEEDVLKDVEASRLGNGDKPSRIGGGDIFNGNLTNVEIDSGSSLVSTRQGNAGGLVGIETRLNCERLPSLEGGERRRPVAATNAVTVAATESNGHLEGSVGILRAEREEGELSPTGEFEEDIVAAHRNDDVANGDDDEEGSGPRSMEESENVSENGDVTGSESNDAEIASHEEGDHDEIENKVERESEAGGVGGARDIEGQGMLLPSSQRHLQTAKPLRKHVDQASQMRKKDSRIFYGNDSIYVLFRLHQALYDRIQTAKVNVSERRWRGNDDSSPNDLYARFLSALFNLLDGSYDNTKFEDECRASIGTQSYILFTLDKLIFKIVKQLQAIATDEAEIRLFHLHAYENSRKPETFEDATYHENASVLLQEENIYRIECFSSPTHISIQLVGNAHEKPEGVSLDPRFVDYIYHDYLSSIPEHNLASGLFLKRNKRKYSGEDQHSAAMEEVQVVNRVEIKISPTSHKGRYALGTEDILFRPRKKRRAVHQNGFSHDQAKSSNKFLTRTQRFNLWLSGP